MQALARKMAVAAVAAGLIMGWAGGEAVASNQLLAGEYRVFELGAPAQGGDWFSAQADVTFDGAGAASYHTVADSRGQSTAAAHAYSVDPDGALVYDGALLGAVSVDGAVVVWADVDAGDGEVAQVVGLRRSSGHAAADLAGDYVMHHLGHRQGDDAFGQRYAMNFDGAGQATWDILEDSRGQSGGGSFAYSVADDGALTTSPNTSGIISPTGELFVSSVTSGSLPSVARSVGVEKAAAGDADLSGVYHAVALVSYEDGAAARTARLRMEFNGAGAVTVATISDSAGVSWDGAVSYWVEAEGTVNYDGGGYRGLISPDRRVLVLQDIDAADGRLAVIVAVAAAP